MRKLLLPLFAATLLAGNAVAQTQKVEVLEYCPAPGQFVNVLPEVEEGMTRSQVLKACEVKGIAQTLGRELGYELAASGENKEKM